MDRPVGNLLRLQYFCHTPIHRYNGVRLGSCLKPVSTEVPETKGSTQGTKFYIPLSTKRRSHYAYHVGQIAYIGRMLRGADWQSLSIPKGQSKAFNQEKFAQPRRREHFTKDFLKKD